MPGQCAESTAAYAEIFGGKIMEQMPASDLSTEFPLPEERKDWVMHFRVKIGNGFLMASDNIMGESARMAGCSVMMSFPTTVEVKEVFDKLADGAEVEMAWAPTFWRAGLGTLTDRFGIKWMIGSDEAPAG